MCLAIPGRIETMDGDGLTRTGRVRFGAVLKEVSLAFLPDAAIGDWILVHAGAAIGKIDEAEAERIFAYLEQLEEPER